MNHDPFYEQIERRLGRVSDGDMFEVCMNELLADLWPTLISVPGGGDGGMDGAWVDGAGPGFLVCTTGEDARGNLGDNLESRKRAGGLQRRLLFVSSRDLTNTQCRGLHELARELGFELAHEPLHRKNLVPLLYKRPRICKKLLGISGYASALSKVPEGLRPLRHLPLIGRDAELEWLKNTTGDSLVVGQPGIGKTFLLQAIVDSGSALFAVLDDKDRLADAVREQQPTTVIVDDAHVREGLVRSLQHLRAATGVEFNILAACWPGAAEGIRSLLRLPASQACELEPLCGTDIVKLLNEAGISGPDSLLRQLVEQAAGRPGLAATLAYLCLAGEVIDVWKGDALGREITVVFNQLVGPRAADVLAAFSLGGKGGMRWDNI